MAHYAKLDKNNKVIDVHVLNDAVITDENGNVQEQLGIDFLRSLFGGELWKQISYNETMIRKNYAGIGYTFDVTRDAFIPPQPYPSWILTEDTCLWDAPTVYPDDDKKYTWNEDTTSWDLINDGWKE